jgi:hypothetical protein
MTNTPQSRIAKFARNATGLVQDVDILASYTIHIIRKRFLGRTVLDKTLKEQQNTSTLTTPTRITTLLDLRDETSP